LDNLASYVTGQKSSMTDCVGSELSAATRRLVETTGLEPVTSCV